MLPETSAVDAPAASDAQESRRRLEACNQALAAAVNARDLLRETAAHAAQAREQCQAELRRITENALDEPGPAAALHLQELLTEEQDLREQLQVAQVRVEDLTRLREQLVRDALPGG